MPIRRRYASYPDDAEAVAEANRMALADFDKRPLRQPTRENVHVCSICVRPLSIADDGYSHKVGEIALSFNGAQLAVQRRICARCIESLRERLRSAISELQP